MKDLTGCICLLLLFCIIPVHGWWWSSNKEVVEELKSKAVISLNRINGNSKKIVAYLTHGDKVVLLHGQYHVEVSGGTIHYDGENGITRLDIDYICSNFIPLKICDTSTKPICETIKIYSQEYFAMSEPRWNVKENRIVGESVPPSCLENAGGVVIKTDDSRTCFKSDRIRGEKIIPFDELKKVRCGGALIPPIPPMERPEKKTTVDAESIIAAVIILFTTQLLYKITNWMFSKPEPNGFEQVMEAVKLGAQLHYSATREGNEAVGVVLKTLLENSVISQNDLRMNLLTQSGHKNTNRKKVITAYERNKNGMLASSKTDSSEKRMSPEKKKLLERELEINAFFQSLPEDSSEETSNETEGEE